MASHTHYLWFETKRRQEILDITDQVAEQVRASDIREGFVLVSAMHITASVFVNDHESGLWHDILHWLEHTVAPWDPERYRHNETGEDNAAAHLRSLTIGHEVIVPVTQGKLDLGPWQRAEAGDRQGAGRDLTPYIRRYLGPLPPSRGVQRGPSTSVALQSTQLGAFTLSSPPTRSYTPAGHTWE